MHSYLSFSSCIFSRNGQLLDIDSVTIAFYLCQLNESRAIVGVLPNIKDAIVLASFGNITLRSSHFSDNYGSHTILNAWVCNVIMRNTSISTNKASSGPVLRFLRCTLVFYDDIIIAGNIPLKTSIGISIESSTLITSRTGKLIFMDNGGFFLISSSQVSFGGTSIFRNNSNSNLWQTIVPTLTYEGGAIACLGSTVQFMDSVTFLDNYSRKNGGALSASGSTIHVHKSITVAKNMAQGNGGGIYLFFSHLICEISCGFSQNTAKSGYGGGLHAIGSAVFLGTECIRSIGAPVCSTNISIKFTVSSNYAIRGGGMYFEANSELRGPHDVHQSYEIIFHNNYARMEGKAIYVDDSTSLATCNPQCFLRISPPNLFAGDKWAIRFNITGDITKSTIFGGLLNECSVTIVIFNIGFQFDEWIPMKGIDYLVATTGDRNIDRMITSNPIRVHYCNRTEPNCEQKGIYMLECQVQRGKTFFVPVTAVDQVNRSVNASISSNLIDSPNSHLRSNQYSQEVPSKCTNLTFNVYSANDNETLHIFLKDQCNNKSKIIVTFEDCTCPVGFHVDKHNKTSCQWSM